MAQFSNVEQLDPIQLTEIAFAELKSFTNEQQRAVFDNDCEVNYGHVNVAAAE